MHTAAYQTPRLQHHHQQPLVATKVNAGRLRFCTPPVYLSDSTSSGKPSLHCWSSTYSNWSQRLDDYHPEDCFSRHCVQPVPVKPPLAPNRTESKQEPAVYEGFPRNVCATEVRPHTKHKPWRGQSRSSRRPRKPKNPKKWYEAELHVKVDRMQEEQEGEHWRSEVSRPADGKIRRNNTRWQMRSANALNAFCIPCFVLTTMSTAPSQHIRFGSVAIFAVTEAPTQDGG